ncbi:MAG: hypothetical protein QNJ48_15450 [Desulfobacterales bacterium]|nr:hypothetical protein [Desulfobacterales bacterium]
MSIVYSFEDDYVLVTPIGFNTFEDVSTAFEMIAAAPAFNRPARVLFDGRQTNYGPPGEELEMLAEFLGRHDAYRGSRWAIIAIPDTLVFALSRMYTALAEDHGMYAETFTDFEAGRAWLMQPQAAH